LQGVQDFADFFQARAERGAHARCFPAKCAAKWRKIFCGLLDGVYCEPHGLVGFALAASAGMHDHEVGAQGDAPDELVVKGLDGAGAQHDCWRRDDQVIGVNDQRTEAEGFTARAKSGSVHFGDARGATGPHARTGGENLQRVAAKLVRGFEGVEVTAGDGVWMPMRGEPSSSARRGFRLRFGAIFVFRVEFDDASEGLFRHSQ